MGKKRNYIDDLWADEYVGVNPHTTGIIYPVSVSQPSNPETIPNKDTELEKERKIVNDYVNAIIFKNPLENLYAYEHLSELQIKALEALQSEEIEKKLAKYREKRDALAKQIEEYNKEALSLSKIKEQVETLTKTRDELSSLVDGLKNSLNKYHDAIRSQLVGFDEVVWEPIDYKDPIFNMDYIEVSRYLNSMIDSYANFFNISSEQAKTIFLQRSPALATLDLIYHSLSSTEIKNKRTHKLIEGLYIPKYYKSSEMNVSNGERKRIDELKREVNLQRVALEANAKAQIAEYQRDRLISVLIKHLPKEMDVERIIRDCLNPQDNVSMVDIPISDKTL